MTQANSQAAANQRVVVMTGATAGIGADALPHIVAGDCRVVVGSRGAVPPFGEMLPLNLSSLASVQAFADQVIETLEGKTIDTLVLNAATAFSETDKVSEDGFEEIFAVNHLAHYLLARLLLPYMSPKGRLVLTTSDVHAQAPEPMDIQAWSTPRQGSGMKAYASSKLCNLLTARSLEAHSLVKEKACTVIAFNPGLTVGTALSRNAKPWQRTLMNNAIMHVLLRIFSRVIPMMYPGSSLHAGKTLAELALGQVTPPKGHVYASLVRAELTYPAPSKLASSDDARDSLWQHSADMVGLSVS